MRATYLRASGAAAKPLTSRLDAMLVTLGERLGLGHCTLSVMLADDATIRDYNKRFRGKDEATDVLSFPAESGDPKDPGHYLGDLIVSLERAREQADEHGHHAHDEVEILVLHGVLHLLGHDHETDAGQMRQLESDLALELFGSRRGLITRAESDAD